MSMTILRHTSAPIHLCVCYYSMSQYLLHVYGMTFSGSQTSLFLDLCTLVHVCTYHQPNIEEIMHLVASIKSVIALPSPAAGGQKVVS